MPRLTKRFVDSLRADPNVADRTVWDDTLPGFGIRVRSAGGMTWVIMYRTKDGRLRKFKIGRIGALTPDEARKEARQRLAEVDKGQDPAAAKVAARRAMSVAELCDLYLADAKTRLKPKTYKMDESRVSCHVKPLIGSRKVESLKLRDIEDLQTAIATGKSARPRKEKGRGDHPSGGRGVAARTVSMVGTMLEFARRRGIVETNVARGVQKFSVPKRMRYLTHEEFASLGVTIRTAEEHGESRVALRAIEILLLTGCRREEILALRWDWLDLRSRCIRFGDTKTGPQLRPLGSAAIRLFSALRREGDVPWIFPAEKGDGHFIGAPRVFKRLCHAAKLKDVTLHTLRHSFASMAAELGYSELIISGLLGHRGSSVTARYAHVPDRALLSAADSVSTAIAKVLDGDLANIIPISAFVSQSS